MINCVLQTGTCFSVRQFEDVASFPNRQKKKNIIVLGHPKGLATK